MATYSTYLSLFLFICFCQAQDGLIVQTNLGAVKGITMTSTEGHKFYAYRGIPYAQPPLGNLRFRAPLPANPWNGTFDGTQDSPICAQSSPNFTYIGTEDCLTLNVYTPKPPGSTKHLLPVFVFIHGGKFVSGDATTKRLPPGRFMNHQIVMATISYRLGAFGFLSTGNEDASGNYGLLDQILALKWIQQNIHFFGGDPQKVTIGGVSAGAASVTYHMASPLGKGLFQSAIAQSGSFLCPWAIQRIPKFWSSVLGRTVGCSPNKTRLVECLRQARAEDISVMQKDFNLYKSFQPVVEKKGVGLYLTQDPNIVFAKGHFTHVPLLTGVNKDELAYSLTDNGEDVASIEDRIDEDSYPSYVRDMMKFEIHEYAVESQYEDSPTTTTEDVINDFTQTLIRNILLHIVDILSIIMFKSPNDLFVSYFAAKNISVFTYVFSYEGERAPTFFGKQVVNHGYEMEFLFNRYPMHGKDLVISQLLVEMWTNFITHQNPSSIKHHIQWEPIKNDVYLPYLEIGQNAIEMQSGYRTEWIVILNFLTHFLYHL